MKIYTFNYFTGYGYREISAHTIETYPIRIKAETFEEAIAKWKKKVGNLSKYNKCFDSKGTIQILEYDNKKERVGIFWIEDEIVKWEGETCYWKPLVFGKVQMQSFKLPSIEQHYGNWIKDFCCGRVIYSYVGWMRYSMERFDYTKFWSTASKEEQIANYKKYVIDEIQYLLKSKHCPEEDKEKLKELTLLNE